MMFAITKEEIEQGIKIYIEYCQKQKERQHAKEVLNLINCNECVYWHPIKGQWSAEGGQLGECLLHKEFYSQEEDYCSFADRKETEK